MSCSNRFVVGDEVKPRSMSKVSTSSSPVHPGFGTCTLASGFSVDLFPNGRSGETSPSVSSGSVLFPAPISPASIYSVFPSVCSFVLAAI